jgi:hypothetical protein
MTLLWVDWREWNNDLGRQGVCEDKRKDDKNSGPGCPKPLVQSRSESEMEAQNL